MKKAICLMCLLLAIILSACKSTELTIASVSETTQITTTEPKTTQVTTTEPETTQIYTAPTSYEISDFECIYQNPELPTGCEITAMDMVLQYYGFDIDKVTLANEYMPTISYGEYWNDASVDDRTDMNNYFIGDPETVMGYIAGTGAIGIAANDYLEETGSNLRAYDITGVSFSDLYDYVTDGVPVVVWVTIGMVDRTDIQYYYINDNDYIEWTNNDHGAVLIGYDDSTVTIADPIDGIVEYNKDQFEIVFESRGNMAIVIKTT